MAIVDCDQLMLCFSALHTQTQPILHGKFACTLKWKNRVHCAYKVHTLRAIVPSKPLLGRGQYCCPAHFIYIFRVCCDLCEVSFCLNPCEYIITLAALNLVGINGILDFGCSRWAVRRSYLSTRCLSHRSWSISLPMALPFCLLCVCFGNVLAKSRRKMADSSMRGPFRVSLLSAHVPIRSFVLLYLFFLCVRVYDVL